MNNIKQILKNLEEAAYDLQEAATDMKNAVNEQCDRTEEAVLDEEDKAHAEFDLQVSAANGRDYLSAEEMADNILAGMKDGAKAKNVAKEIIKRV